MMPGEKMKNKRITFILGSLRRGGAERVISILSRDYAEIGWDVDILLLLFSDIEYELHPNVKVYNFSGIEQSRMKRLPYWLKSIRRYVTNNEPDVVLAFAARINIIAQIACFGVKKRFFISERNDPRCDGRSKLVDLATKILYPKADGVVFQTKHAASYFPKLRNSAIIANPISVEAYAVKSTKKKLVAVGRLDTQKNHKMLINAFVQVVQKFQDCTLEIYGRGKGLENEIKKQIVDLGLENCIFLMGNVSNIHECIADASVFVLSSDYEGLSNALLEAMMMGLPCISTNCAGSDEYIRNGENGLLVPTNDENAMAQAINQMLSNDAKRQQYGKTAAEDAVAFMKENVLLQWHAFLDEDVKL
ncbi:MAG: glycosyl transferase group 1 [Neobacillus sp.]|jgi:glycosyltransferase involved in cell wall biosynthesis|nr:glycosyl transferase group 1 [Neobacillus sp.]